MNLVKFALLAAVLCCLLGAGFFWALKRPPLYHTLGFGRGADSVTLDPALISDGESASVGVQLFEGLLRFSDDYSRLDPCLATSWEGSADGKEWIFHLRRGVRFHDGNPFTAEAVEFSLRRKFDRRFSYYRKEFLDVDQSLLSIKGLEAVDPFTIHITLNTPFAPFLAAIANYADIVSPEAVRRWGTDFEKHPVGTGPFSFVEWIPEDRIILRRNDDYWGERARLDRIVVRSIPDNNERLLALKTGAIQVMDGISPDDFEEILNRQDLHLQATPGLNIGFLAMNLNKKPFNLIKVRLAVNYAINKQNLVKIAYRGFAIPARNPIPPTMWGFNDAIADYEYDPAQARRLLKEAGYKNGFETTLWTMPIPRPYMSEPRKIAEAIKANLNAVGIKTTIYSCDWENYLARTANGEHDMALLGYTADSPDPDDLLSTNFSSEYAVTPNAGNIAFFKNADVDDLLMRARQEVGLPRRIELYKRVLALIHEQAPWVPLAHAQTVMAYRSEVHDILHTDVFWFNKAWRE